MPNPDSKKYRATIKGLHLFPINFRSRSRKNYEFQKR